MSVPAILSLEECFTSRKDTKTEDLTPELYIQQACMRQLDTSIESTSKDTLLSFSIRLLQSQTGVLTRRCWSLLSFACLPCCAFFCPLEHQERSFALLPFLANPSQKRRKSPDCPTLKDRSHPFLKQLNLPC